MTRAELIPAIDLGTGRVELTPIEDTVELQELPVGPNNEWLPASERCLNRISPLKLVSVRRERSPRTRQLRPVARFERLTGERGSCCVLTQADAQDPFWDTLSAVDRRRLLRAVRTSPVTP